MLECNIKNGCHINLWGKKTWIDKTDGWRTLEVSHPLMVVPLGAIWSGIQDGEIEFRISRPTDEHRAQMQAYGEWFLNRMKGTTPRAH